MKFKGTIIGEASGSVASLTFSHNRGGQYIRQRAVPVNPNTPQQQAVRGFMSLLSARWGTDLTPAQRAAWETYALNVPIPDTLGEPRNIGGLGMYNRTNVARLQAGLLRIDAAPIIFNLGTFTNPTLGALSAAADTIAVNFTNTDAWAIAIGGAMTVFTSRPQNQSITGFKGPYRLAGVVLGAAIPPVSPAIINAAFPFGVANRVFVAVRFHQTDGRLSSLFRMSGIGA